MRITGGYLKGRVLKNMQWKGTRPSTDMTRQALCNVLSNYFDIEAVDVLDLFAGTGIVSLEFISRGAKSCISIDKSFDCFQFMQNYKRDFEIGNWDILKTDVYKYLRSNSNQFDIIFADPPYELNDLEIFVKTILESNLFKENAIFVLEHRQNKSFCIEKRFDFKKYGDSVLSFYKK